MNYYKYLDLDYESVHKDLRSYLISYNDKQKIGNFWTYLDVDDLIKNVPSLPRMFESLNLTIYIAAFISTSPKYGMIHIDDDPGKARINLPIINCEFSETRFFVNEGPLEHKYLENGIPYWDIDPAKCRHVDTLVLDKPAVLNIGQPHQVVTHKPPRVAITIKFHQDINHLLN